MCKKLRLSQRTNEELRSIGAVKRLESAQKTTNLSTDVALLRLDERGVSAQGPIRTFGVKAACYVQEIKRED